MYKKQFISTWLVTSRERKRERPSSSARARRAGSPAATSHRLAVSASFRPLQLGLVERESSRLYQGVDKDGWMKYTRRTATTHHQGSSGGVVNACCFRFPFQLTGRQRRTAIAKKRRKKRETKKEKGNRKARLLETKDWKTDRGNKQAGSREPRGKNSFGKRAFECVICSTRLPSRQTHATSPKSERNWLGVIHADALPMCTDNPSAGRPAGKREILTPV